MKPHENNPRATKPQTTPERHDRRIGTLFDGRYQITSKLGTGITGSVYHARVGGADGRSVALKVLGPRWKATATTAKRLLREGETLAKLAHPNLLKLERLGVDADGRPFLVTELVEGMTLRELLTSQWPLAPEKLHDIALQLGLGLGYAHTIGHVIHRDLKPDNLLITRDGWVKIIDFGLVKSLANVDTTALTEANTINGSPAYMAPEQITSGDDISYAADLYSVGCLLYECLTGKRVFHGRHSVSVLCVAHLHETPAAPARNGAPLEGPFVDLVMQCLAKKPKDRPRSAHTLVDILTDMDPMTCIRIGTPPQRSPDPTLLLVPPAFDELEQTLTLSRKELQLDDDGGPSDLREFQRIPIMSPEELALPEPSAAMAQKLGYMPAVPERWSAKAADPAEDKATVFLSTKTKQPASARSKAPWLIAAIVAVVVIGICIAWLSGCTTSTTL